MCLHGFFASLMDCTVQGKETSFRGVLIMGNRCPIYRAQVWRKTFTRFDAMTEINSFMSGWLGKMTGKTWLLNLADDITETLIHVVQSTYWRVIICERNIISIDQGQGLAIAHDFNIQPVICSPARISSRERKNAANPSWMLWIVLVLVFFAGKGQSIMCFQLRRMRIRKVENIHASNDCAHPKGTALVLVICEWNISRTRNGAQRMFD